MELIAQNVIKFQEALNKESLIKKLCTLLYLKTYLRVYAHNQINPCQILIICLFLFIDSDTTLDQEWEN